MSETASIDRKYNTISYDFPFKDCREPLLKEYVHLHFPLHSYINLEKLVTELKCESMWAEGYLALLRMGECQAHLLFYFFFFFTEV